jgi:hypothetical protein
MFLKDVAFEENNKIYIFLFSKKSDFLGYFLRAFTLLAVILMIFSCSGTY